MSWPNTVYNIDTGELIMEIVPMRDLKDTVKIESLCKENGKVFVTKNGYGRLVVMDIDYYKENIEDILIAKEIQKGIEQAQNGETLDGKTAIKNIKSKYEL